MCTPLLYLGQWPITFPVVAGSACMWDTVVGRGEFVKILRAVSPPEENDDANI